MGAGRGREEKEGKRKERRGTKRKRRERKEKKEKKRHQLEAEISEQNSTAVECRETIWNLSLAKFIKE